MINTTTQDTLKTIEIGINKSSLAKEMITDISQRSGNHDLKDRISHEASIINIISEKEDNINLNIEFLAKEILELKSKVALLEFQKRIKEIHDTTNTIIYDRLCIIETTVTEDVLAEYLTAEKGENLGIYANGAYAVGMDIGNEIDIEERPIACVECPGMNNIDTTHFTDDFVTYNSDSGLYENINENHEIIIYTLEEVIYDCCRNREVIELIEDLKNLLSATR